MKINKSNSFSEKQVRSELVHPEKIFWPKEGYTKGDLLNYYLSISKILLPYLRNRPESLHRYPDGIKGESFYHKNIDFAPDWAETLKIEAESTGEKVNYLLCQNLRTLAYMINLGCIDINPWNSRVHHLAKPDYLVLDLDPEKVGFEGVIKTALVVHDVLEKAGIVGFPKTSGASGLHIFIPLGAKYTYKKVRKFAKYLAELVHQGLPVLTSIERNPVKRKGKVYIDYLQNSEGQTLASAYSVRATPKATVSTPLTWDEVQKGVKPEQFTMMNMLKRIQKKGDLFLGVLGPGIDIERALHKLKHGTIS